MKPSTLHSNSIINIREGLLINQNRIKRMITAADYAAAAKILIECGYDERIITRQGEFENFIINDEYKKTVEIFKSLCNDESLLSCVLIRFDYHNAAIMYGGFSEPESLYPFGALNLASLKAAIHAKKYNDLSQNLGDALRALDAVSSPTSSEISVALHTALRAETEILSEKIKSPEIRKYFEELNRISAKFASKEVDLAALAENDPENSLAKIAANGKDKLFDLNLLFHWFIMKQNELKIVKTILMGKKLGMTREKIRELIRGVYDYFK